MTETRIKQLSSWSMILSMLCAVHCALMPVLIVALSFSGSSFISSHFWEVAILGGSLLLAGIALAFSYRNHQKISPLLLFAAAVLLAIPALGFHVHALNFGVSIFSALALGLNWWISRSSCEHAH